jgi:Holliday junction resolvasome RuvABC endonuclease subunit
MKILGIDPGLQVCGYACIESEKPDSGFRGNDMRRGQDARDTK